MIVNRTRIDRMVAAQRQAHLVAEQEYPQKVIGSFERFVLGGASMHDVRRCVTGSEEFDPKANSKVWLSGVPVRRARRRAGLEPGRPVGGVFRTVAEYLSFDTTEVPTEQVCRAIERIKSDIFDTSIPPRQRMEYASAYMVLGKNPERTRKKFWDSGKLRRLATKTICRLDTDPDITLPKDWAPIAEQIQRLRPVPDNELRPVTLPDGRHLSWPNPTHQQVADVITTLEPTLGLPGSDRNDNASAARTGQKRPPVHPVQRS